jgi:hypothetical protein
MGFVDEVRESASTTMLRAATPDEAGNMMKAAQSIYHWACGAGHAEMNPLVEIKKIHRGKGGATPWASEDRRKQEFESHGTRWLGWQPKKRGAAFVETPLAAPLRKAINAVARIGAGYILSKHGNPFRNADSYRNWFTKTL